jgi:hypothetical protein
MGNHLEPGRFRESVVLITKDVATGRTVRIVEAGPNIVTDVGDKFYARRAAGETVNTNSFPFHTGQMIVGKSLNAAGAGANKKSVATFGNIISASFGSYSGRQSFASGYPKTADSDTDNTARTADGITYKRVYTTAQANQTIRCVGICRAGATTNSSGQLLSVKTLTTAQGVVKTSSLTLTVYVTHVFLGV